MSLMLFVRSVSVVFWVVNVVDPDLLLDRLRSLTKSSAVFSSFSLFSISLALTHLHSPLSQSQQHFLVRLLQ